MANNNRFIINELGGWSVTADGSSINGFISGGGTELIDGGSGAGFTNWAYMDYISEGGTIPDTVAADGYDVLAEPEVAYMPAARFISPLIQDNDNSNIFFDVLAHPYQGLTRDMKLNSVTHVDFFLNNGPATRVMQPTLNAEGIEVYRVTMPAGVTQDVSEVRAVVYPKVGIPRILQGHGCVRPAFDGGTNDNYFYYNEIPSKRLNVFNDGTNKLWRVQQLTENRGAFVGNYTEVHIGPTGDDTTGDGSAGNPYATVEKARTAVTGPVRIANAYSDVTVDQPHLNMYDVLNFDVAAESQNWNFYERLVPHISGGTVLFNQTTDNQNPSAGRRGDAVNALGASFEGVDFRVGLNAGNTFSDDWAAGNFVIRSGQNNTTHGVFFQVQYNNCDFGMRSFAEIEEQSYLNRNNTATSPLGRAGAGRTDFAGGKRLSFADASGQISGQGGYCFNCQFRYMTPDVQTEAINCIVICPPTQNDVTNVRSHVNTKIYDVDPYHFPWGPLAYEETTYVSKAAAATYTGIAEVPDEDINTSADVSNYDIITEIDSFYSVMGFGKASEYAGLNNPDGNGKNNHRISWSKNGNDIEVSLSFNNQYYDQDDETWKDFLTGPMTLQLETAAPRANPEDALVWTQRQVLASNVTGNYGPTTTVDAWLNVPNGEIARVALRGTDPVDCANTGVIIPATTEFVDAFNAVPNQGSWYAYTFAGAHYRNVSLELITDSSQTVARDPHFDILQHFDTSQGSTNNLIIHKMVVGGGAGRNWQGIFLSDGNVSKTAAIWDIDMYRAVGGATAITFGSVGVDSSFNHLGPKLIGRGPINTRSFGSNAAVKDYWMYDIQGELDFNLRGQYTEFKQADYVDAAVVLENLSGGTCHYYRDYNTARITIGEMSGVTNVGGADASTINLPLPTYTYDGRTGTVFGEALRPEMYSNPFNSVIEEVNGRTRIYCGLGDLVPVETVNTQAKDTGIAGFPTAFQSNAASGGGFRDWNADENDPFNPFSVYADNGEFSLYTDEGSGFVLRDTRPVGYLSQYYTGNNYIWINFVGYNTQLPDVPIKMTYDLLVNGTPFAPGEGPTPV